MAWPTIKVEFDAHPNSPGEFIIGSSLLGGSDLLAVNPRWVDISTVDAAVLSGVIVQGRQNVNNPITVGTLTLSGDNRAGNYDPDNINGVFYPYLTKGTLVRVSAVVSAVSYPLFVGRLDSVTVNKGPFDLSATMTFYDDLQQAGYTSATSYNTAVRPETSLSRAQWLTSQLPMLYAAPTFSSNLTRNLLPTYGGSSILDLLNVVATTEQGRVFVDPSGSLNVTAHADDYTSTVLGTLTDDPAVFTTTGLDYQALVTSAGRTQQVQGAIVDRYNRNDSNYPSVYGGNVGAAAIAVGAVVAVIAPLQSDSDAQSLANYLASRRSTPPPSIDAVTVALDQANSTAVLGAKIGQRFTV